MKNNIKKEIFQILDNVAEQHKIIDSYETQIPQIELDIILSNIRKLYENYTNLIKINKQQDDLKPKEEGVAEKKSAPIAAHSIPDQADDSTSDPGKSRNG